MSDIEGNIKVLMAIKRFDDINEELMPFLKDNQLTLEENLVFAEIFNKFCSNLEQFFEVIKSNRGIKNEK